VRLEHREQALAAALRGADGGADLLRVVGVVVDDADAVWRRADDLEAPGRPGEARQQGRDRLDRDPEVHRHQGGGRSVFEVVQAGLGDVQGDLSLEKVQHAARPLGAGAHHLEPCPGLRGQAVRQGTEGAPERGRFGARGIDQQPRAVRGEGRELCAERGKFAVVPTDVVNDAERGPIAG
jgi:hypothetical protein